MERSQGQSSQYHLHPRYYTRDFQLFIQRPDRHSFSMASSASMYFSAAFEKERYFFHTK